MSEFELIEIIKRQSDSNNNIRKAAELQFSDITKQDPSQVMGSLLSLASKTEVELAFRQSSLLHVRRLVPKFWSIGFGSFTGPPVAQDTKTYIRSQLMKLLGDQDSKIRNSAAYVIVQISAVDYPDEWPSLLDDLYSALLSQNNDFALKLGTLAVLRDLFDDLVTEDQFFEGGVGPVVLQNCEQMLVNHDTPLIVKIGVLKLFSTCVSQMENTDVWSFPQRKQLVDVFVPRALSFLRDLLSPEKNENWNASLIHVSYLTEVFSVVFSIVNAFNSSLGDISDQLDQMFYELALYYLDNVAVIYNTADPHFADAEHFQNYQVEYVEPQDVVKKLTIEALQLLPALFQGKQMNNIDKLTCVLLSLAQLTEDTIEAWEGDFNEFVSKETEISIEKDVRDTIQNSVTEFSGYSAFDMFKAILYAFQNEADSADWKVKEARLFLMGSALLCDDDFPSDNPELSLEGLVNAFSGLLSSSVQQISDDTAIQLLVSRIMCFIPRLFIQFKSDNAEDLALETLNSYVRAFSGIAIGSSFEIIKSSILISFSYFKPYLPEEQLIQDHQTWLIAVMNSLISEFEEDTGILVLETLKTAIDIDNTNLDTDIITLIYNVSLKFASSFAITQNAEECLESVLSGTTEQKYFAFCEVGLGPLLKTINEATSSASVDYSPEMVFVLELLTVFLKQAPLDNNNQIPSSVFVEVFPVVSKLTFQTTDDQLLESLSEAYVQLLERSSKLIAQYRDSTSPETDGFSILLKIISKFLSPDIGDSAIANLGDLIVALIHQFDQQSAVGHYFEEILKAVTVRLIAAKNVVAISSLIMVFCDLAVSSSNATIDFLSNFEVDTASGPKRALDVVMPIWFESFEVIVGHEKIQKNIEAFIQIMYLNDSRMATLIVDGDALPMQVDPSIIITRSMAKNYQTQYTKIPATVKIVKLLVQELKTQSESKDNAGEVIEGSMDPHKVASAADDDDDGWEDLDDVGVPSFQKLQSFVEEEDEAQHSSYVNEDTRELLKLFFKQIAGKPEYGFEKIYEYLTDEEKKTLTEYVFF